MNELNKPCGMANACGWVMRSKESKWSGLTCHNIKQDGLYQITKIYGTICMLYVTQHPYLVSFTSNKISNLYCKNFKDHRQTFEGLYSLMF